MHMVPINIIPSVQELSFETYHVSICAERMVTLLGLCGGHAITDIIANINRSHKEEERQKHE